MVESSSSTQRRKELSMLEVEEDEHLLQIPTLPQEVIADILSRLPVRSVCKFRCVSKLWLSMTSDPLFAQAHLRKTLKDANFASPSQRILFCFNEKLYSVDYESIRVANGEIVVQELHCPLRSWPMTAVNLLGPVGILGSCNGLACISFDLVKNALFLFNPTTGESKRIPDLGGEMKNDFRSSFYGFGYDEVHDDYKVVNLRTDSKTGVIYSARNDAWKRVVHGYETSGLVQMGSFLDGAIHWVSSCKDEMGGSKRMVVVLDLATEIFWDMPAPDGVDCHSRFSTSSLNGCLYLRHSRCEMQGNFWVMTEYGAGESWTEVTTGISCRWRIRPLFVAPNGEMLLQVDRDLVLCNHGDQSSRKLVIGGIPSGAWLHPHMYVESLISPNGFCRSHTYQVQK